MGVNKKTYENPARDLHRYATPKPRPPDQNHPFRISEEAKQNLATYPSWGDYAGDHMSWAEQSENQPESKFYLTRFHQFFVHLTHIEGDLYNGFPGLGTGFVNAIDLFAVFDIPWDATQATIERLYKAFLRKYHPDSYPKNLSDEEKKRREAFFKAHLEQFKLMANPLLRERYVMTSIQLWDREHPNMRALHEFKPIVPPSSHPVDPKEALVLYIPIEKNPLYEFFQRCEAFRVPEDADVAMIPDIHTVENSVEKSSKESPYMAADDDLPDTNISSSGVPPYRRPTAVTADSSVRAPEEPTGTSGVPSYRRAAPKPKPTVIPAPKPEASQRFKSESPPRDHFLPASAVTLPPPPLSQPPWGESPTQPRIMADSEEPTPRASPTKNKPNKQPPQPTGEPLPPHPKSQPKKLWGALATIVVLAAGAWLKDNPPPDSDEKKFEPVNESIESLSEQIESLLKELSYDYTRKSQLQREWNSKKNISLTLYELDDFKKRVEEAHRTGEYIEQAIKEIEFSLPRVNTYYKDKNKLERDWLVLKKKEGPTLDELRSFKARVDSSDKIGRDREQDIKDKVNKPHSSSPKKSTPTPEPAQPTPEAATPNPTPQPTPEPTSTPEATPAPEAVAEVLYKTSGWEPYNLVLKDVTMASWENDWTKKGVMVVVLLLCHNQTYNNYKLLSAPNVPPVSLGLGSPLEIREPYNIEANSFGTVCSTQASKDRAYFSFILKVSPR